MIVKLTETEAEIFLRNLMNPPDEIKEARRRFVREAEAIKIDNFTIYSENIDAEGIESVISLRGNCKKADASQSEANL